MFENHYFLVVFLLRLSRIKCSQLIPMGKFGPAALIFAKKFLGFSSTLKVTFLDTLCMSIINIHHNETFHAHENNVYTLL